jgi:hypothetical protein
MCFGAMQASKTNTKVTKKFSSLYTENGWPLQR